MSAAKKIILLLWIVVVASVANVSALTPGATETRVGQKSFAAPESRPADPLQTLDLRQRNHSCGYELAPESLLAAETGASRLNIFGTGEARGFLDVSPNAYYANGRPLTSGLANGSASDIFIRSAPITGENTIPEILRLSQPGTRVTLMQSTSGFQGQALIDAFGNRATVDFMRTFQSQTVYPGWDMTILRMTVGGH